MREQDAARNVTLQLAPPRPPVTFTSPVTQPEFYRRRPDRGEHVLANPAAGGMGVLPSSTMRRVVRPPGKFGSKVEVPDPAHSSQLNSSAPHFEAREREIQEECQAVSDHSRALRWTPR